MVPAPSEAKCVYEAQASSIEPNHKRAGEAGLWLERSLGIGEGSKLWDPTPNLASREKAARLSCDSFTARSPRLLPDRVVEQFTVSERHHEVAAVMPDQTRHVDRSTTIGAFTPSRHTLSYPP
jgi:hypothetical protein